MRRRRRGGKELPCALRDLPLMVETFPFSFYQQPNRLISISTIVQLLASSPICRRPLRPRYKGLSELRTCCWSARLPGSPRNLPRAPPRAPAPAPPPPCRPSPLSGSSSREMLRRKPGTAQGPSGRAGGPAFSTSPPIPASTSGSVLSAPSSFIRNHYRFRSEK